MTTLPPSALIAGLLLTVPLRADVDTSRLSGKWLSQEVPEAISAPLKAGGMECDGYFTIADKGAVLMHNSKKFKGPIDPSEYDAGLESVKVGYAKAAAKAGVTLSRSEILNKDGIRLLHQEHVQDGVVRVVLNQMNPTSIEQISLTAPAADRDALVAEAYDLFHPLPSSAQAPATAAAAPPVTSADEPSDAYKFGHKMGVISFAVLMVALVLKLCGVMKFSKGSR